jgi:hypothetical protein
MKRFTITLLAGLGLLAAGCKKDNYSPPESQLTGRVLFQNEPVGVRGQGGVQLELWQRGEAFRNKISISVTQDGTYSATLFDGDYKLTRLRDNGPWQNNTDSIDVQVRGNTVVDVPVQPYYVVRNATFTKNSNTVQATCRVNQIATGRDIEYVTLFVNYTQFVDNFNGVTLTEAETNANTRRTLTGDSLSNLNNDLTLSFILPTAVLGKTVYARIGVKTQGVGELFFSPVQKISL